MINNKNNWNHEFHFMATGIGSVPSLDVRDTCARILGLLPEIPFWPQFVRLSHLEDMNIQFSEGLPLLRIIKEKRSLTISSVDMESELVTFYDHFLADDLDYFLISSEYASGLYKLLNSILQNSDEYGPYVKGQTVGPVTFAAGIADQDGKSILYNPELLDAMVKGLAIKALWQAKELKKTGKQPIIFIDEPYLSGFGSAFTPIQSDKVILILKEIIDYLRERSDTLIGIHCCGNTDWSMLIEAGPDIINFDAFGYMDYFLLYPEEISRFLKSGGIIAWGIVPTAGFTGEESLDSLYSKLKQGLSLLHEWGLTSEMVTKNSILTPACGMGTMEQALSERVLNLLSQLSKKCRDLTY